MHDICIDCKPFILFARPIDFQDFLNYQAFTLPIPIHLDFSHTFYKMSSMSRVIMALATGASLVSAHGYVSVITIDGTEFAGYPPSSAPYENPAVDRIAWSDTATDNGYVAPDAYASGDIICHRGAENAALTATVAAGGTVSLQWNTWPESHHGPVINYLADCGGDCTTVDKTTLEFFKIAESGLIDETTLPGTWASDVLLANNLTQTITIPSTLKAGSYVLRHEIIALHSAGSTDGAQNYPQCINLEVTGSGTELPAGTLGTALYTEEDAGILVNIYQTLSTYGKSAVLYFLSFSLVTLSITPHRATKKTPFRNLTY